MTADLMALADWLAAVATDPLGVSGRRMLEALVAGTTGAATLAALAKRRLSTVTLQYYCYGNASRDPLRLTR
jgi:hypothetical protein